MSSQFRISFVVPANKLTLIVDLLKNEAKDLDIKQIDSGVFKERKPRATIAPGEVPKYQPRNDTPIFKLGREFCAEWKGKTFKTGPEGALGRYLVKHNVNPSNAGPLGTYLERAGLIRRTTRGEAQVL